jgi:four helix bundle protein
VVVRTHRDLVVYQRSFEFAMRVFELTKAFPREELYSMTDQMRRCSRSVSANIAEAWQKRRYQAAFVAKIVDAMAEAGETQNWLDYAFACGYLGEAERDDLFGAYQRLLTSLNGMADHAAEWCRR